MEKLQASTLRRFGELCMQNEIKANVKVAKQSSQTSKNLFVLMSQSFCSCYLDPLYDLKVNSPFSNFERTKFLTASQKSHTMLRGRILCRISLMSSAVSKVFYCCQIHQNPTLRSHYWWGNFVCSFSSRNNKYLKLGALQHEIGNHKSSYTRTMEQWWKLMSTEFSTWHAFLA